MSYCTYGMNKRTKPFDLCKCVQLFRIYCKYCVCQVQLWPKNKINEIILFDRSKPLVIVLKDIHFTGKLHSHYHENVPAQKCTLINISMPTALTLADLMAHILSYMNASKRVRKKKETNKNV